MIANKKFIVALALLAVVVAMVAQAEPDVAEVEETKPDGGKICKEEVGNGTDYDCTECCNKNGFVYGYFQGFLAMNMRCKCTYYDREHPAVKGSSAEKIFGQALRGGMTR